MSKLMTFYSSLVKRPYVLDSICFCIYTYIIYQTTVEPTLGLNVYGAIVGLVHLRVVNWRREEVVHERLELISRVIDS